MSILSKLVVTTLPFIPKSIVGFFARPYIAGESLDDGIRVVKDLQSKGIMATMDVLGESVTSKEESIEMRNKCEAVLHAIEKNRLDSNLSLKLTQLGLRIDPEFCEENIRFLCQIAKKYNNFIRIDMEDHPHTDLTLRMYENLRKEFPRHVGAVIQAYMRRSANDIQSLLDGGFTNLRLCKGIYIEPADIAFRDKSEVRRNFLKLYRMLIENGAYVAIATHDEMLIEDSKAMISELGLEREQYEFQMLLGVRPQARDKIVSEGHRMRVYVPFGDRWYAYSTRRLKESPDVALHIVKALLGFNK